MNKFKKNLVGGIASAIVITIPLYCGYYTFFNPSNSSKNDSELREQRLKENPIIIQDLNGDGKTDIAATTEYGATQVYLQLDKKDTYQRLSDYVATLPVEQREPLKNTIEAKLEKIRGHEVRVF